MAGTRNRSTVDWGRKWLIDINAGKMDVSVLEEKSCCLM